VSPDLPPNGAMITKVGSATRRVSKVPLSHNYHPKPWNVEFWPLNLKIAHRLDEVVSIELKT
jgi:hypothetical protein